MKTLQKILLWTICSWFILLFKKVSDLPTVGEGDEIAPPPLNRELGIGDRKEKGDPNFMEVHREERMKINDNIYGNENRLRKKNNITVINKRLRQSVNHDTRNINNSSGVSIDLVGNVNVTKFYDATNATANYSKNKNLLLEVNYNDSGEDDFNGARGKQQEKGTEVRRGRNQNHHGTLNHGKGKPSVRQKPPLLLPTPIIVMGFPKAGTSSIFSFFQSQGLISQHWYCCEGGFLFN